MQEKGTNLPQAEFKQGRQLLDFAISTGLFTSLIMNTLNVMEGGERALERERGVGEGSEGREGREREVREEEGDIKGGGGGRWMTGRSRALC